MENAKLDEIANSIATWQYIPYKPSKQIEEAYSEKEDNYYDDMD